MITDSEKELEKIFLSYSSILQRFKLLNIRTKGNKEITHKDLRRAADFMVEKHPSCRWKGKKPKGKRYYILIEGYYWLILVYFNNEKVSFADADIDFFTTRIKQYEEMLHSTPKVLWEKDMNIYELENYFHRAHGTIKNNIIKMNKATNGKYKYCQNGQIMISKFGIEWLCKNCFKQKYLELLEEYKMELTEKYIERGFPYDIF